MTEAEEADILTAAGEADRLRTDPAFQAAILAMRADAVEALKAEEKAVIEDMLEGRPTNVEGVRTRMANIAAIDNFCTELAKAIIRVPRKPMMVA